MKVNVDRFDFVETLVELGYSNAASHILYNYFEGEDVYNPRTIKNEFREYKISELIELYIDEFEEFKNDHELTHIDDSNIMMFCAYYLKLNPIAIYYIDEDIDNVENGIIVVKVKS